MTQCLTQSSENLTHLTHFRSKLVTF